MARTTTALTDVKIKAAKTKEKDYKLGDGLGLFLVVRKSGSKFWRFDFKYANQYKSMSFGIYPEVSLLQARTKREEAREQLKNNINPISAKKQAKESEAITLDVVVKDFLVHRRESKSAETVRANKSILKNITDYLGNVAVKDITSLDIIELLKRYQKTGVIESAHRLYSLLDDVYKYAVTNQIVDNNIIANIDKKVVLKTKEKDNHYPALIEEKDIKQLLNDIDKINERFRCDISTVFLFKIIPYVFVRSENIRLMRWDEINFEEGLWEIPKTKMKMKIDFVCPLPEQAIKILKEIEPYSRHRSEYVFPSPQKYDRGVAGGTLSNNLNRLGYQDRHSIHGFRSMFSTTAHNLYREHGFHSDIIEACLAHKERNRVKAAYNRVSKYKYIEEKRELLQWYADWLDKIKEKEF